MRCATNRILPIMLWLSFILWVVAEWLYFLDHRRSECKAVQRSPSPLQSLNIVKILSRDTMGKISLTSSLTYQNLSWSAIENITGSIFYSTRTALDSQLIRRRHAKYRTWERGLQSYRGHSDRPWPTQDLVHLDARLKRLIHNYTFFTYINQKNYLFVNKYAERILILLNNRFCF